MSEYTREQIEAAQARLAGVPLGILGAESRHVIEAALDALEREQARERTVEVRLVSVVRAQNWGDPAGYIPTIKAVREATGLPLKEAKDAVDCAGGDRGIVTCKSPDHAAKLLRECAECGTEAHLVGRPGWRRVWLSEEALKAVRQLRDHCSCMCPHASAAKRILARDLAQELHHDPQKDRLRAAVAKAKGE